MERILRSDEIAGKIPDYMTLPLPGFINKNHHLLMFQDDAFTAIRRNFTTKGIIAGAVAHTYNLYKMTTNPSSISLLRSLVSMASDILTIGNIYAILQTMHFTGIQGISTGRGLTNLKDNRVNYIDDENESIHRVLSPYEFIIFDKPVHAVADGVVKEIVDKYPDEVNSYEFIDKNRYLNEKERYGNYIDIEHNDVINSRYACMKLHGFTKKVGDTVKQGEIIGRVGASNAFLAPELIFQFVSPKDWYNIPGKIENIRTYVSKGINNKWNMHMEVPIINRTDYETKYLDKWDQFRNLDLRTLKYYYVSSYINPGCLIKQFPTILSE